MKCPKCHEKVKISDVNCPYCGKKLIGEEESQNTRVSEVTTTIEMPSYERKNMTVPGYERTHDIPSWVLKYQNQSRKTKQKTAFIIFAFFTLFAFGSVILLTTSGFEKNLFLMIALIPFVVMAIIISCAILNGRPACIREYNGSYVVALVNKKEFCLIVNDKLIQSKEKTTSLPVYLDGVIPNTSTAIRVCFSINGIRIYIDDEISKEKDFK